MTDRIAALLEADPMSLNVSAEVEQLVAAQIASGRFATINDVLLDALRKQCELMPGDEDALEDDWPAIKEALDSIDAGDRGRPAEEVFEELRQKHSL